MPTLAGALTGHLVGDYLVQNDWMAKYKTQSSFVCGCHVLAYSLAVMLCSGWFLLPGLWWIWLSIAVPHFLIDRFRLARYWMQWMGQKNFAEPPLAPWSLIVVDNTMHAVCLLLTSVAITLVG